MHITIGECLKMSKKGFVFICADGNVKLICHEDDGIESQEV